MKRKPRGHPIVYMALGLLAIGLWFIPHQHIADGATNFTQNLTILNVIFTEMTVTTKLAGTFALAMLAIWYNGRKK